MVKKKKNRRVVFSDFKVTGLSTFEGHKDVDIASLNVCFLCLPLPLHVTHILDQGSICF